MSPLWKRREEPIKDAKASDLIVDMIRDAEDNDDPLAVIIIRRDRSGAATDRENSPASDAVQVSAIFDPVLPTTVYERPVFNALPEAHKVAMRMIDKTMGMDDDAIVEFEASDGTRVPVATAKRSSADEARDMADAHAEGLHEDLPREGCPECER